jgi:hypothetical protein
MAYEPAFQEADFLIFNSYAEDGLTNMFSVKAQKWFQTAPWSSEP